MKTLTTDRIISIYRSQVRSTDLWVGVWNKNHDISGAKNALTALGKLAGVFNVLLATFGDENLPEDIIEIHQGYMKIWDEIMSYDLITRR